MGGGWGWGFKLVVRVLAFELEIVVSVFGFLEIIEMWEKDGSL